MSKENAKNLFTPIKLGPYELKNRVVMSPMTRQRAEPVTSTPNEMMAQYYAQRAGAGLIVTECVKINEESTGYRGGPGILNDLHVRRWREVTQAVHAQGGKIFLQLWHAGRVAHSSVRDGALPLAPSAIAAPGQTRGAEGRVDLETPREMTLAEIKTTIQDFASSTARAIDAGADGVELHGGFGYLVDTFLQESSNKRTDQYGGPVANRIRFAVEVVEAMAAVAGPEKVGVRLGPSTRVFGMMDSNPVELFGALIKELDRLKIAYIHMLEPSEADIATGTVAIDQPTKTFRSAFSGRMISNVGFNKAKANEFIESGTADMVSFGKLFISNPDLPHRLQNDLPLAEVDFSTLFTSGRTGYIDYPVYKAS